MSASEKQTIETMSVGMLLGIQGQVSFSACPTCSTGKGGFNIRDG